MQNLQQIEKILELLEKSLKEDAPILLTSGGIIADGYDEEVDETRSIMQHSKERLANYQSKLIAETSINTLKIKYTNVTGYFIEVPKSQTQNVPPEFIVKQTLVTGARFTTQELRDFEKKLIEGEMILAHREYKLFEEIRNNVLEEFKSLKKVSEEISVVDFIQSLSTCALQNNYVCPNIHEKYDLEIIGGRHPVIETIQKDFVTNSISLDSEQFVHVITGPNMGGKSTFLRQNALIILLAHIGSFVPAKMANIPLTDKIFSRVGATDNLAMGQSTFMVEMQETANIIHNSTKKSFVIIDEIGRGTSTYDGMSLAWAILKYNHDTIQAKTLFATHYHELVDDSESLKHSRNFSVAVGENEENLVFLRKIIPGGMKKSYGIEVARIAGIPQKVIEEAKNMLKKLELEHRKIGQVQLQIGDFKEVEVIYKEKKSQVEEDLKNIDINAITPIEAINLLMDLKKKINS